MSGTGVTNFATWDRETLNKFAQNAADEIAALQEELRVAIDAYRKLVIDNARKTN
jgi:hypothetical protein